MNISNCYNNNILYSQTATLSQSLIEFEKSIFITDNVIVNLDGKKIIQASRKRDFNGHISSFFGRLISNPKPQQQAILNWIEEQKETYSNYIKNNFEKLDNYEIGLAQINRSLINKIVTIAREKFVFGSVLPTFLKDAYDTTLSENLSSLTSDHLKTIERNLNEGNLIEKKTSEERQFHYFGNLFSKSNLDDKLQDNDKEDEDFQIIRGNNLAQYLKAPHNKNKIKVILDLYKQSKINEQTAEILENPAVLIYPAIKKIFIEHVKPRKLLKYFVQAAYPSINIARLVKEMSVEHRQLLTEKAPTFVGELESGILFELRNANIIDQKC